MSAHQYDEGHTVAGWTGFAVAVVGTVVLGLGVCTVSAALLAGGLGILVLSLLVTWVLHLAGWGKPSGGRPREQWGWRTRDLSAREGHPGCVGCRLAGRGTGARRGTRSHETSQAHGTSTSYGASQSDGASQSHGASQPHGTSTSHGAPPSYGTSEEAAAVADPGQ
jgi:hypothetical protein